MKIKGIKISVIFNRNIVDDDIISPGGYSIEFEDGTIRTYDFDSEDECKVKSCSYENTFYRPAIDEGLTDEIPESRARSIKEIFIYTEGDLRPIMFTELTLISEDDGSINLNHLLPEYNKNLAKDTEAEAVRVWCQAYYMSYLEVPKGISREAKYAYMEANLDKIPVGALNYLPMSDSLDKEDFDS